MYSRSWKKLVLGVCLVVCLVNIFNVEKVFAKDEKKVILYVTQDDRLISSVQTA